MSRKGPDDGSDIAARVFGRNSFGHVLSRLRGANPTGKGTRPTLGLVMIVRGRDGSGTSFSG